MHRIYVASVPEKFFLISQILEEADQASPLFGTTHLINIAINLELKVIKYLYRLSVRTELNVYREHHLSLKYILVPIFLEYLLPCHNFD